MLSFVIQALRVEFSKLMHIRPEPSQFGGSGSEEDRIENAHKLDLNKVKKSIIKITSLI